MAAICHGPWLLINSGLADGRALTSWPSLQQDLTNAGANWRDAEVVVDGNVITSRKPDDIPAFSEAVVKHLPRDALPVVPAPGRHASERVPASGRHYRCCCPAGPLAPGCPGSG